MNGAPRSRVAAHARAGALFGAVAILATSCGARFTADEAASANAEFALAPGQTPAPTPGSDIGIPGSSLAPTPGSTLASITPSGGGGGSGGGSGGGGSGGGSGGGGSGGGGAPAGPGPHPGVSNSEIKVCYLVPLSGAAPIPTNWRDGANLYWDDLGTKGGVHGRNVKLIIQDTTSDSATALARARECITQEAFTFVTLDRLEVEATVGRFLNSKGIPNVLIQGPATSPMDPGSDQTSTFAITIDHRAQGRLIADYLTKGDLAGKRYSVVREDVPDLVPGVAALKARLKEKGISLVAEAQVDGQGNDFSATITKLKNANAEVVWFYGAPTPMIKIAQQSQTNDYHPVWFGNSISWNFNTVAQVGNSNGALDGARVFSPWVSLSSPAADEYKAAWNKAHAPQAADDIGLVGWGVGEVLHSALRAAGRDLGYNTFRSAFQSLNVTPKTWAPLRFGPGVRVGSSSIMEFRLTAPRQDHWEQVGAFRSSF
ncbi:MAG: ABC transporter substrate-binding protein [Acidobacteria bacterium]|nr:ABC transporter substrate-binding protein [Acidobacteriota bacterium]